MGLQQLGLPKWFGKYVTNLRKRLKEDASFDDL